MSTSEVSQIASAEGSVRDMHAFLIRSGLAQPGAPVQWTSLVGGVSSDIWMAELPDRKLCIKRALPKLKVEADWEAPVSRNAYEWEWMKFAASVTPDAVPAPLAQDLDAGLFAMEYLPPEQYPVWKNQLMAGQVDQGVAAAIGKTLAQLHKASRGNDVVAREFATDANFHALRLEPYLVATARRHPHLAVHLHKLVHVTANTHQALVHGDVSPKNILVGAKGPVILDAECAWYGDPAFDVAFFLNHLLLKCLVKPAARVEYLACFESFIKSYFEQDYSETLEARAANLLPALLLARVDGKSPVEYITDEFSRDQVRGFSSTLLESPQSKLWDVAYLWNDFLQRP